MIKKIEKEKWNNILKDYQIYLSQKSWHLILDEHDELRKDLVNLFLKNFKNELHAKDEVVMTLSDDPTCKMHLSESFQSMLTFDQKIESLNKISKLSQYNFYTEEEIEEGILTFNDFAYFEINNFNLFINFKIEYLSETTLEPIDIPKSGCCKVVSIYI